jgi:DNA mismatch repair protein MutS
MKFKTDEQTMLDLSIKSSTSDQSIAGLFKPITRGGQLMLMHFIDHPPNDAVLLNKRLNLISYIDKKKLNINFDREELDFIEFYLNQGNRFDSVSNVRALKNAVKNYIKPDNHFYIIERGVNLLLKLLNNLDGFFKLLQVDNMPEILNEFTDQLNIVLNAQNYQTIRLLKDRVKLSSIDLELCDFLFRSKGLGQIKKILEIVYQMDLYLAVAYTAAKYEFTYPLIVDDEKVILKFDGLFHPLLLQPIKNNIIFSNNANLCFVTGANMAGKSTFLKAVGIAVLLAHVGFPVPASSMTTSLFNGLFTTINLSDNVNAGHSHFYAEVLRIKQMACHIKEYKKVVIIFDELFRGTNVKDAYDASVQIIKSLAHINHCVFIVSTHIIEAGEQLNNINNIFFKCLTTTFNGSEAVYDYILKDGITSERLGMKIIEDEGVFDMLNSIQSNVPNNVRII